MNEIKLKVNFGKRTIVKSGISLTTGDYNSTKIIFEFDREDGTKIFEMKNPNNELVFSDEIVNNEIILVGKAEVTTIHNDVTYTKYLDDQENVYWYDKETEKIYDSEFIETTGITLDDLEVVTEDASLFTMAGRYIFEISLYDGNSKLTSKSDYLDVKEEQVIINDNMVSLYLPVFDRLMGELETLNIDVNKIGTTATVSLTKKDGTTDTVEILDGEQGEQGEQGIPGRDGYTPQKGIDYFTEQDIESLKIPTKTSQLQNDSGFLTEHQDISMKQNIEDNTLETAFKTIPQAINEVNHIAKGATQAISFPNYQQLIMALNILPNDYFNVGQNLYIVTLNVPDLWVSFIESTSQTYTYTTDEAFTTELATNGYVQVGYYRVSALETQKVDLTNYVTNTDYASENTGGVIKVSNFFNAQIGSSGNIYCTDSTYSAYQNKDARTFISKGTLENVITGKQLTTKSYVDGLVGDIATAIDGINAEVI